MNEARPITGAIRTSKRGRTTYQLYANGEVWTKGKHGYRCGYASATDADTFAAAIGAHEAELRSMLAEFL